MLQTCGGKSRFGIQNNLHVLKKQSKIDDRKVNNNKCNALHLCGEKNQQCNEMKGGIIGSAVGLQGYPERARPALKDVWEQQASPKAFLSRTEWSCVATAPP